MIDDIYDKLHKWMYKAMHYYRYEATPYDHLDMFFEEYQFSSGDRLVDFGCGRGWVALYIHNRFQIPVKGVEVDRETYEQALKNRAVYLENHKHISAPVHFHYGAAEDYKVEPEENRFYFFNPFSVHVFKKVTANILESVREHRRSVDIILYYPTPEYERFLKHKTPFRLVKQVSIPETGDEYDKFLVYRY
jgi:SAM-dependent methyltransferase